MPNPIADPFVENVDSDAQSDLVLMEATPEGAVTVTINRADKKNAFNDEVIGALSQAFESLHGAEGVRVVFVRGAGGTFSAGADLDWMKGAIDRTEEDNRADAMAMATMLKRLYDLPALTVALVEGGAFGGGAGLAAACDMAIAVKDASFAFAEVKLGLIPATVSPYVVLAIGPKRARRLFATAQAFDAAYAREIGLIDEVVEDAAALEAAKARVAADIIACAPEAVDEAKRLVEHIIGRHFDHALIADTAHRIAAKRVGDEGQEGVRAFLEGRKPRWVE